MSVESAATSLTQLWFCGRHDARFEGVLNKIASVSAKLQQRRLINVDHVAGFVEGHPQIIADGWVELHTMHHVLCGVVRWSQVVIAAAYPQCQLGDAARRSAQCL